MKRSLFTGFLVIMVVFSFVPSITEPTAIRTQSRPKDIENGFWAPSENYDINQLWDSVYSSVSENNIRTITRDLSEDYENRVWFPLHKEGSDPLQGAWAYANSTLKSNTGNELHFDFVTEELNLVAIKQGTDPDSAPIIFAANIAASYSPGANRWGASVGAVLEVARVLNSRNLTNDIYFVLVNAYGSTYGGSITGNYGIQSLLANLNESRIRPSALFWFDKLLYDDPDDPQGDMVSLYYDRLASGFSQEELVVKLADLASDRAGLGKVVPRYDPDASLWEGTGAEEAWVWGIPGFSFSQWTGGGFWGGEYDEWDVLQYDYAQAKEAAGVAACLGVLLGRMGNGVLPVFNGSSSIGISNSRLLSIPTSSDSYLNATIAWTTNTTLEVKVQNPFGYTAFTINETDGDMQVNYLPLTKGVHNITITNLGNESAIVEYSIAHFHDYDQDNLDDQEEFLFGSNSLSADTDRDLLNDDLERDYGTDPRNEDTDSDSAMDGIEHALGSNPLVQDSDADGILDGQEIDLGMNPTSNDSDSDGVLDNVELENGWNPLSNDTDSDGLIDSVEIEIGTMVDNPDSDEDGLSDLFEVLNGLNPLSADSDSDGLSDAYEVEHCLKPFDPDTDADGIPDSTDWAPRTHWVSAVPIIGLGIFTLVIVTILLKKRREYLQGG